MPQRSPPPEELGAGETEMTGAFTVAKVVGSQSGDDAQALGDDRPDHCRIARTESQPLTSVDAELSGSRSRAGLRHATGLIH